MPNEIFGKVLKENHKFSFENDIYSEDFFEFLYDLQKSILTSNNVDFEMKRAAFNIGIKANF